MNRQQQRQRWREQKLKARYGITPSDINFYLLLQNHKCGICGAGFSKFNPPVVDHNHKTGKIRGLLDSSCNSQLGWMEKYQANILWWLAK